MSDAALDKCNLLSIFIESVFWGVLLSLYMITIYLLLQKKSSIAKHAPLIVLVTVMFILSTLHVSLSFARIGKAFFKSLSPVDYFKDIRNTLYQLEYGVLFVQIFLMDLVLVFRSFLLWNKNYCVAFGPTLMAVGTFIAAAGALHAMSVSPHDIAFDNQVQNWIIASFALGLATKVICFFLVVFRVLQIHSTITAKVDRHFKVYTLLVVLVESGFLALLTAVVLLPTFVSRLNAHVIIRDALSPITGITVSTIIACMKIKLSNPPVTTSRPVWNRYSIPQSPMAPSHVKKSAWNDYDDDSETGPTTPSPALSRPESIYHVNQSTGTLNMGIVL